MRHSKDELYRFLEYLQDKVEGCYKSETRRAIDEFLEEEE